jgi:GNAT superfamily N-acetyltransferase
MSDLDVVRAREEDIGELAVVLARAFQDDPAFSWAAPDPKRRERHGTRYFELTLHLYLPKGEVWTTADLQAVAIWAPPDKWEASASETLTVAPTMIRACGRKVFRAISMLNSMEKEHKRCEEPHYYLPFIAADPAVHGRGYGTALLAHMAARCDGEGRPAYLESTSVRNQALYHRHGFVPLDEQQWPGGGPPWWPMWRPPRSA